MSEQNDPQEQDQQHRDEPADSPERTEAERTTDQAQEEIDELEANGVDDLQDTSGVTEVTDKVNRAEGPVL